VKLDTSVDTQRVCKTVATLSVSLKAVATVAHMRSVRPAYK